MNEDQIALMLHLQNAGKTHKEIADVVGVSESSISRAMAKFTDTRKLAKAKLIAAAGDMAEQTITAARKAAERGDAGPALEVLDRLDVLASKRQSAQNVGPKVMVVVGGVPTGGSLPSISALPELPDIDATEASPDA